MHLDSQSDDLPDDLLRIIALNLSRVGDNGLGRGGMNVLRLVSKRLMRVVESCATRLTKIDTKSPKGQIQSQSSVLLPLALGRCKRIEHIRCDSRKLESLEGCPDGLKSLVISYGQSTHSLGPLRGCTQLEIFEIGYAFQITDLSPLNACIGLKKLVLTYSQVADISALASMSLLEDIKILGCSSIKSLDPLSGLKKLKKLNWRGNNPQTSLLPLASCTGLGHLRCDWKAVHLKELQMKLPHLVLLIQYY